MQEEVLLEKFIIKIMGPGFCWNSLIQGKEKVATFYKAYQPEG